MKRIEKKTEEKKRKIYWLFGSCEQKKKRKEKRRKRKDKKKKEKTTKEKEKENEKYIGCSALANEQKAAWVASCDRYF